MNHYSSLKLNSDSEILIIQSKIVALNRVSGGYLMTIEFQSKEDKDIQILIDRINDFDSSFRFRIKILSQISFTKYRAKKLLKALLNKRISRLDISK